MLHFWIEFFALAVDCVNVLILGKYIYCKSCGRFIGCVEQKINGLKLCRFFGVRANRVTPVQPRITGEVLRFAIQTESNRLKRKSDVDLTEFEPASKLLCIRPEVQIYQISRIDLDRMFSGIRGELDGAPQEGNDNVLPIFEDIEEFDVILDWERMTEHFNFYADSDVDLPDLLETIGKLDCYLRISLTNFGEFQRNFANMWILNIDLNFVFFFYF